MRVLPIVGIGGDVVGGLVGIESLVPWKRLSIVRLLDVHECVGLLPVAVAVATGAAAATDEDHQQEYQDSDSHHDAQENARSHVEHVADLLMKVTDAQAVSDAAVDTVAVTAAEGWPDAWNLRDVDPLRHLMSQAVAIPPGHANETQDAKGQRQQELMLKMRVLKHRRWRFRVGQKTERQTQVQATPLWVRSV